MVLVSRNGLIDFRGSPKLQSDLSFRMGKVKMSHSFGDSEKAMNVASVRKHCERNVPGCCSVIGNNTNHPSLPYANSPKITVEQFLIVVDGTTVTSIDEGRRKGTQPRKSDQIVREWGETS